MAMLIIREADISISRVKSHQDGCLPWSSPLVVVVGFGAGLQIVFQFPHQLAATTQVFAFVINPARHVGLIQAAWCWEHSDAQKLSNLMDTFRENGTAWVPTLVVLERIIASGGHDMKSLDPNVVVQFRKALHASAKLAVQLHRGGGLVGIGTDFPIDGLLPGDILVVAGRDELVDKIST